MAKATKRIPDGCHSVIPYLVVSDANQAIEFYKQGLGALELMRMPGPDGKSVLQAELRIGGGFVYVCDEFTWGSGKAPTTIGGTCVSMHLYVADVDASFARATAAGATEIMPPTDMFWGDRFSKFSDPFGHHWSLASHIEDVPPEDVPKRVEAFFSGMSPAKSPLTSG